MPKPLSTRKRNTVLADIRAAKANGSSVRKIATAHGIAPSTVTRIAKEHGLGDAFERSQTRKATRAREDDCKALRAQLKLDLLTDAQRFRKRAWESYQVVVGTPEGAEIVHLDLPPLPDARAAYTAIGIAVDKSIRLEQHDSDEGGVSAVDEWLRGMLGESR